MAGEIASIGVVGLGTMGAGIAEVFARGGLRVVGVELDPDALVRGRGYVEKSTGRAVARGRLSPGDQSALLARITFATELEALADVDLVIEAVPERLSMKQSLFGSLDDICRPDTILATNTSSLSVTDIAASTGRPGQVIGMHFFNPAPVMKLVEIVHSVRTDDDVVSDVRALAERMGKTAVVVADRAGFVVNRLLFGYLNQAAGMFEAGRASREDIDTAMTVGADLPMGPLTLLDLIGLDTSVQILDTIYAETGDRRYTPAPVLRHLVAAGYLGRKTGRGLYDYRRDDHGADDHRDQDRRQDDSPIANMTSPPGHSLGRVGVIGRGAEADAVAAGGVDVVRVDPTRLKPLNGCDVAIDTVGGPAEEVRARFAAIGRAARSDTVLIATAGIPTVLECAVAAGYPGRVVGLSMLRLRHDGDEPAGNRADVDRRALGQVVASAVSTPAAVDAALTVANALGLTTVRCTDHAGFIVDALLLPHLNDALLMRQDGYASAEDIDAAMRSGCGYRQGPFALLERLGANRVLDRLKAIYAETPEPGLAPAALLRQMAALEGLA